MARSRSDEQIGRDDRRHTKVQNNLFELIKGSDIGVTVYNFAKVDSTPGKPPSKPIGKRIPGFLHRHVTDYAEHFS